MKGNDLSNLVGGEDAAGNVGASAVKTKTTGVGAAAATTTTTQQQQQLRQEDDEE